MKPWLRYVIALLVAAHGFVYVNAARGVLPVFDGWRGSSWLLGGAVTGDALKRLSVALWAIAGVGVMATGIAVGFAQAAEDLWRPLAIVASAVGVLSFFVFWDGRLERLFAQGVIGMILSLALLVAALAFPHALGVAAR